MIILRTLLTLSLLMLTFRTALASPLFVYAQSPIHSNVLSTQLRSAQPNRAGTIEFKSSYTQASIWAHTGTYSLDYYQNQSTMDFNNAGVHVSDFESDDLTNALTFYNELLLYSRGPMSLSAGGSLFYNNVKNGLFARTSFEQGIQLNYSYITPRHSIFSTLGLVHRNSDGSSVRDENLSPENLSTSWAIGYEYRLNQQHSLVIESLNYQGWASNDPDFSETSNEVVVGYRYRLYRLAVETLIVENIRNMDNSTDIGFTLGLRFSI